MTKFIKKFRSTGSQPAMFYGLAKLPKNDALLRLVLPIPGSSYENLNSCLTPFFQKLLGASTETKAQDSRKALESLPLEDNEQMVSLDLKSLYINGESTEMALTEFYSKTWLQKS